MIETLVRILKIIYEQYVVYCANSKIVWIFLVSLIYLCFAGREYRKKVVYPSLLLLIIVLNPVLYLYFYSALLRYAYWRLMWIIPVVSVICVALVDIIRKLRIIGFIGICAFSYLIIGVGTNIYTEKKQFEKATNLYKLPQSTIELADKVLEIDDAPFCVMPEGELCYVRQYKTEIKQLYGRNIFGFINSVWEMDDARGIYQSIKYNSDYYGRVMMMKKNNINLLIDQVDDLKYQKILGDFEYQKVGESSGYDLYYAQPDDKKYWVVNQLGFNCDGDRMGYVIEGAEDQFIIIDGGYASDKWMVDSYVRKHGNHINAWILTKLDDGHLGIFKEYIDSGVVIDKIIVPNIPKEKYGLSWENDDSVLYIREIYNLFDSKKNVVRVNTGDCIDLDGLMYEAVSVGDVAQFSTVGEIYNAWTMIFSLKSSKNNMVFCSDATEYAEPFLKNYIQNNEIDYLETAGHRGLMSKEFYDSVNPKIILFDCPTSKIAEYVDAADVFEIIKWKYEVWTYNMLPNVILLY